eukprot:181232_1
MQASRRPLGINGIRTTGLDVRKENVTATVAVANVVKSSLGPIGLDKMLVDEIGDVVVTNDGATILKRLDVEHPAGRMLVDLAQLQDQEIGDGTTSVIVLTGEFLSLAKPLLDRQIHPLKIVKGYAEALNIALKAIDEVAINVDVTNRDELN